MIYVLKKGGSREIGRGIRYEIVTLPTDEEIEYKFSSEFNRKRNDYKYEKMVKHHSYVNFNYPYRSSGFTINASI